MLKTILYSAILMFVTAVTAYGYTQVSAVNINNLPSAETTWHRGPGREWEVNFNDAVAKAKETKKKVYMLAIGSDWCPPCKALKQDVLSHDRFKRAADSFTNLCPNVCELFFYRVPNAAEKVTNV